MIPVLETINSKFKLLENLKEQEDLNQMMSADSVADLDIGTYHNYSGKMTVLNSEATIRSLLLILDEGAEGVHTLHLPPLHNLPQVTESTES